MGDPVLSSEGFHPGLHHRARLYGATEARVTEHLLRTSEWALEFDFGRASLSHRVPKRDGFQRFETGT
jgi:hypothetical protein